jgi:hypothetical protein
MDGVIGGSFSCSSSSVCCSLHSGISNTAKEKRQLYLSG